MRLTFIVVNFPSAPKEVDHVDEFLDETLGQLISPQEAFEARVGLAS